MIERRCAIRAVLGALMAAWLLAGPAAAQDRFQRFVPFLIDLPGWTGKKADGVAMEMTGMSMVSATREYERGEARLTATILVGPAAEGALQAANTGIKIETGDVHINSSTVDGLPVFRTFTLSNKAGMIVVGLRNNAMFSLASQGVEENESLALAKRFDWKAIQNEIK